MVTTATSELHTGMSQLVFPGPPARPGDLADFSGFAVPVAGGISVPPLSLGVEESRPFAQSLVRVMGDDAEGGGPWLDLLDGYTSESLIEGLRDMMRMRVVDQRLMTAQRQGKTSFYLQCTGEEAIGCGFQRELDKGDMNFPTYRQQSLLIGADYPLNQLMGQIYSNAYDPLQGRQLPTMHSAREYGYFSISGNLGTQFVQAVGWGMAGVLQRTGKIAAAWIGDGATAASDFHSGLLFASVYRPPVVMNVVNNQWAISTHANVAAGAAKNFANRALGYGIPALRVDGNDYLAVRAVSKWAISRARSGYGPVLIEWLTYRAGAHSSSDDPSAYRPKQEVDEWPFGDPVARLSRHLALRGIWSAERQAQLEAEIQDEVSQAQKEVEARGTFLTRTSYLPAAMFDGVYETTPSHLRRQRQKAGV